MNTIYVTRQTQLIMTLTLQSCLYLYEWVWNIITHVSTRLNKLHEWYSVGEHVKMLGTEYSHLVHLLYYSVKKWKRKKKREKASQNQCTASCRRTIHLWSNVQHHMKWAWCRSATIITLQVCGVCCLTCTKTVCWRPVSSNLKLLYNRLV